MSIIADVVIMSAARTPPLKRMTQNTIRSCLVTARPLLVNVIVLEQEPGVTYRYATTMPGEAEFNYNAFANRGAAAGTAPWIVIANNDLTFHPGWLQHLLDADHPLVSPRNPRDRRQMGIVENTIGDRVGTHLSGWCFMIARELLEKINGFDDCVTFWCSDDVVIEQVKEVGVQPMLVPKAVVDHQISVTLRQSPDRDDLTWRQIDIFNRKYGPHRLSNDPRFLAWKGRNP